MQFFKIIFPYLHRLLARWISKRLLFHQISAKLLYYQVYILFAFLLFPLTSVAQTPSSSPIDKTYWIDYYRYQKPTSLMSLIDPPPRRMDYTYRFQKITHKFPLQFDVRPLRIDKVPQKKLYGNYIKAGVGNYFTSYAEAFFNTRRNERYSYGLHLRHLQSRIGVIDRQNSGNTRHEANFNFKRFFKGNRVLYGGMDFENARLYFYGYQSFATLPPPREQIRQDFNIINAQIHYTNKHAMNTNTYNVGIGYHYWADHYKAREQEIEVQTQLNSRLNSFQSLLFRADASSSVRTDIGGRLQRNLLSSEVLYQANNAKIRLEIGGRFVFQNDTLQHQKTWRLYPKLYFSWSIWKNRLNLFTGIEGNTQKRLLRSFIAENPFLNQNIALLHTNQQWESFIGVQTQLATSFNWQAKISYGNYQNLHFFVNDANAPSKFVVQYENASTPVLHLLNEVVLSYKKLKTSFKTEFYKYDLPNLPQAWHRPLLKNTLTTSYRYSEKLFFDIAFFHLAGIQAFDVSKDKAIELQPITDLSLKIDYHFKPTWSAFVKGNNLLAQNYQRYLNYEVRTAEVIAGITFAF